MSILAIDTSMTACSAALLRVGAREAIQRHEPMTRGHAEAIFPMIEAVMAEAACGYEDLEKIAVTLGPGSFTGVRAGVAAARGLALAAKRPVVGVGSFEVMAHGACRQLSTDPRKGGFAVVHDARRGEVYTQQFDADGGVLSEPRALSVEDALGALGGEITLVLGSGAQMLSEAVRARGRDLRADLPGLLPEARDLAHIALIAAITDRAPAPLYLRPPDAKPQTDKSVARVDA